MSLGFAASMGIAGGLDTVDKYSYQEWLNQQQLKTDQLRREAELEWRKNTLDDEIEMERRRQLAAADTQMEIFEQQAPMRAAQNREAIQFDLDRFKKLAPEERRARLADERAKQELVLALQEEFFERNQALTRKTTMGQTEVAIEVADFISNRLKELDIDEETIDRVYIRNLTGMDIDANQYRGAPGSDPNRWNKDQGQAYLEHNANLVKQGLESRIKELIPDDLPTAASLASGKPPRGGDAAAVVRRDVDSLVSGLYEADLGAVTEAVRNMEKYPSNAGTAWSPVTRNVRAFVELFGGNEEKFERIMRPTTPEEAEESIEFFRANFEVWQSMITASQAAAAAEEQAEAGLAAPYGPNVPQDRLDADVRGAFAEEGVLPDESIMRGRGQ